MDWQAINLNLEAFQQAHQQECQKGYEHLYRRLPPLFIIIQNITSNNNIFKTLRSVTRIHMLPLHNTTVLLINNKGHKWDTLPISEREIGMVVFITMFNSNLADNLHILIIMPKVGNQLSIIPWISFFEEHISNWFSYINLCFIMLEII